MRVPFGEQKARCCHGILHSGGVRLLRGLCGCCMMPPMKRSFLAGWFCCMAAVCAVSCSRMPDVPARAEAIPGPAHSVRQGEVVKTALAYTRMVWHGDSRHVLHGKDPDGLRVDTPDAGVAWRKGDAFWWRTDAANKGMPYKWGGFDTPRGYLKRLQEDVFVVAGDYSSEEKVRLNDDAVSRYAAGVDCSGFVSRCWRLAKPYSTRELAALCRPLASVKEMQPGDIMLREGVHVVMFLGWHDAEKKYFHAAEAGGIPQWKCYETIYLAEGLKDCGYAPYRYRKMKP